MGRSFSRSRNAERGVNSVEGSYYGITRWDVIDLIPEGTRRLLDVGCGEGHTGAAAKRLLKIQEVVGVELNSAAVEIARSNLDKVHWGDVENMELDMADGYFDCILCADVLEHTKDPWQVLSKLRRYLDDEGTLIASLPNLRHIVPLLKIVFDRFEYQDGGILDRTHLRFFTLHTIKSLFEATGYRVVRVEVNKSSTWKFHLLDLFTFGLLRQLFIYQYRVVARKHFSS